jgi:small subunit ribosomal protein S1
VDQQFAVGQVVTATITKLASFGAFAKMDDSIEGLIHISELADYRINHPKEIVQEGDVVQVRVIRIDPQRRRIGLSLRRASEDAYVEMDWQEEAAYAQVPSAEEIGEEDAEIGLGAFRPEQLQEALEIVRQSEAE